MNPMRAMVWCLLSTVVVGGLSCTDPTEPGNVDEPAVVRFHDERQSIVMPDTVVRGVPFEVRVPTYGGGCTRAIARTDVHVVGTVVEIRPVNRTVVVPGGGCTRDLLILEHRATVIVTTVGTVVVRVLGVERNAETGNATIAVTIDRQIVVRPAA
jgi:hypothetical protein